MSLNAYTRQCVGFIEELEQGWSEDDRVVLLQRLKSLGRPKWYEWREAHSAAVAAFAMATPHRRRKLSTSSNDPLLLRFAALQFLAEAARMLEIACRLQDSVGISYRDMAGAAGTEFLALLSRAPAYAPDDFFGPNWTSLWRQAVAVLNPEQ